METILMSLLILGILLLVLSFFTRDKIKDVEQQIEQLSLSLMQETYQLKKKMRVLEEELLVDDPLPTSNFTFSDETTIKAPSAQEESKSDWSGVITERIKNLFDSGFTIEEIARRTSLSIDEVNRTLLRVDKRG